MMLKEKSVGRPYILTAGIVAILALWFVFTAFGQSPALQDGTTELELQPTETSQSLCPSFYEYRGVTIGMHETELLERIGTKPRYESEDDYLYVFSASQSAQFLLDADRKVKMISIKYSGNYSDAPTHEDVFGKDVAFKMTADGKVHNLAHYPEAGFWVDYYRSAGDPAVVMITIQKL